MEEKSQMEHESFDKVLMNIRQNTNVFLQDLDKICSSKGSQFVLLNGKIAEYNTMIQEYQNQIKHLQNKIVENFQEIEKGEYQKRKH